MIGALYVRMVTGLLSLLVTVAMFIYRVGLDWLAASLGWAGWERVDPSLILSVVGQFAGRG